MTAPTPLDQDELAARASDAGVPVEFDADHAYATIGGRVYRTRLAAVTIPAEHVGGCNDQCNEDGHYLKGEPAP